MKFIRTLLFPLAAALLFLLTMYHASDAADAVRAGLRLSFGTAVPALFPFFVAGALLTDSGLASLLGTAFRRPMRLLYGLGGEGAIALVLGLTGGYPVGAQTVCALHRAGQVSTPEAERLLGFCNNTGPAFILGVAGIGVCGSARTGLMLYGIHALSALLTGLFLPRPRPARKAVKPAPRQPVPPIGRFPASFVAAVQQAFQTSLLVAAFVTGAALLLALLQDTGVFAGLAALCAAPLAALGLPRALSDAFFSGVLELTNGIVMLPALGLPRRCLLPVLSFLLAFGGLSVHCQTLALTQKAGLSVRLHTRGKLLHGLLAALLTGMLCAAAPQALPVFSVWEPQRASAPFVGLLLPFFLLVAVLLTIYDGKHGQNRL